MIRFSFLRRPRDLALVSYHIPKTAGTSFRKMLEAEFGKSNVVGLYRPQEANAFSRGFKFHFKNKFSVIHGHFKPHKNHKSLYPSAKTMVWVRDPVERIWSHVGHLLKLKEQHPHFDELSKIYFQKRNVSQSEIVSDIIKNRSLPYMVDNYSRFFSNVPINDIDFVGSIHQFDRHVLLLNEMLSIKLKPKMTNVLSCSAIPREIKALESFLCHEYEIVSGYL
jgi:hypothetical protein